MEIRRSQLWLAIDNHSPSRLAENFSSKSFYYHILPNNFLSHNRILRNQNHLSRRASKKSKRLGMQRHLATATNNSRDARNLKIGRQNLQTLKKFMFFRQMKQTVALLTLFNTHSAKSIVIVLNKETQELNRKMTWLTASLQVKHAAQRWTLAKSSTINLSNAYQI